ncbi:Ig-like domain-containing protein [Wenzhouxiangella sediminis]|nr:Ig-like domain-containing protein [Wenzhouxiangella sediminis]
MRILPLRIALAIVAWCFLLAAESTRAQGIALDFDGFDDEVAAASLPNDWAGMLDNGFTVSFRIRLGAVSSAQRVFFIQQDADNFASVLLSQSGEVYFYVTNGSVAASAQTTGALPVGTWTDVSVRWQPGGDGTSIWIDGQDESFGGAGSSSVGTDGRFTLGARTDGAQRLTGTLDEFRIWGEPLDAASISSISENLCVLDAQLVHDYQFEVGTPGADNTGLTTLPDLAGANPGTLWGFSLMGPTSNWVSAARDACVSFDLGVTASAAPDPVAPGGQVTWSATLTSSSQLPTFDVPTAEIELPLPAGTRFVSLSQDPSFNCATPPVGSAGTVSCQAAALTGPDSHQFSVTTDVDAGVAPNSILQTDWRIVQPNSDSDSGNDEATTSVQVGNALVLVDDAAVTNPGVAVAVDVLANDADSPGGPGIDADTLGVSTQASNGTASCAAGSCSYSPDAGFSGVDSFRYTVCDAGTPQVCDEAEVRIAVAPSAVDDAYATQFDTPVSGNLLDNDTAPTGATVSAGAAANGNASVSPDGSFSYTPAVGFAGTDAFTYTVCLASPDDAVCDSATASISVAPAEQTIDFPSPGDFQGYIGESIELDPTASSGLPVQLTSESPAVCRVTGTGPFTVTFLQSGTCVLRASQPGDGTTLPADDVVVTFQLGLVSALAVPVGGPLGWLVLVLLMLGLGMTGLHARRA